MRLFERPVLFSIALPILIALLGGLGHKNGNHRGNGSVAPAAPPRQELTVAQVPSDGGSPSDQAVAGWKMALEQPEGWSRQEVGVRLYLVASSMLPAGRYQEVESICREILSAYPGTHEAAIALWILALARVRQGDAGGALSPYEAVISAYPDSGAAAQARLKRGELFELELKDHLHAFACYEEVGKLYPGTVYEARALHYMGRILHREGDFADARDYYLRSVEVAPGEDYVRLIGENFWRWGYLDAGVYALESYLANSPSPVEVSWVNYLAGLSCGNLGAWPTAISHLTQALQAASKPEEAAWSLYQLALAQKASANLPAAKATVQSLVYSYPNELPAIRAKDWLEEWR